MAGSERANEARLLPGSPERTRLAVAKGSRAWIVAGHLDDQLTQLGDRVIRLLAHPQIQARTFAALILAVLVHRDTAAAVLDTPTGSHWPWPPC
jgi:hypothetical protein